MAQYGNGTRAYMEAYGIKNEASAAVLASRLINKTREVTLGLYEQAGLGMDTIIQLLKDATKAEKRVVRNGKVYTYPDHYVRLKTAELIYKFSGMEAYMDKGKIDNQVNVQIISDREKGIFRVQDAE